MADDQHVRVLSQQVHQLAMPQHAMSRGRHIACMVELGMVELGTTAVAPH
jgi:hypothetical protein